VLELGQILDDSGLPNVFIGLEQLPAPDIELPSNALARQIGQRAAPSVLRVVADGCNQRASGTAFVIAPEYLVTNAHVVVGAQSVIVQTSGDSYRATPVLIDLDLDVALLFADGVRAPPLTFARSEPVRGALGATVGYPGGGNETVERATVAASYFATGLDVTGKSRVTRRIIELRARVIPGDSGGPLVLEDGTVGGVVFAESKVDPAVGYALSPLEVIGRVSGAIGRTQAVDTGPCVTNG
jgi:S1-C subfamily serine protease